MTFLEDLMRCVLCGRIRAVHPHEKCAAFTASPADAPVPIGEPTREAPQHRIEERTRKMADYCHDCSISIFGEDFRELAGLSTAEDTAAGLFASCICESCGPTLVDHEGRCVDECAGEYHAQDGRPCRARRADLEARARVEDSSS